MFNRRSTFKFMKIFRFPACLIAALTIYIHTPAAQISVPVGQNSAGVAKNGGARATNARPNGPTSQNVGRRAVGTNARTAYVRPTQTVAQRPVNSRSNYSARGRPLNSTLAAMSARQNARTNDAQPDPDLLARNDVAQSALPITNGQPVVKTDNLQPASDDVARHQMSERPEAIDAQRIARPDDSQLTRNIPAREEITPRDLEAPDVQTRGKVLQRPSDEVAPHETQENKARHEGHGNRPHRSFSDALRCHRHEWHDRNWWKRNCNTIVFVNSGYYFLDAGYWYPAWGYDPVNSYYDYDGPIYTYGNLLPDQVIANVQEALQDAGYYFGAITGSLNVETRAALANFQRDYGLLITGAIDQPTIETLGLY
jgi:Putative peptidoglycan binding domain